MGDDNSRRRGRGFMGDDERAAAHRRSATPARGSQRVPTVREEDDELTPPPQPPPRPTEVPGFETIAPPIQNQLVMLSDGVRTLTSAMEGMWPGRDADQRLSRLDHKFDTLSQNDAANREAIEGFLKPAVKSLLGRLDLLINYHETNRARIDVFWEHQWPAVQKSITQLDDRLDRIERNQDRHEIETKGALERMSLSLTATLGRVDALESRVQLIEMKLRDEDVAEKATTAMTTKQKATIVAAGGLIATLGAAIAQLIGWLRS